MGRSLGADKVLLSTIFICLSLVYQDFFGDLPYLVAGAGSFLTALLIIFERRTSHIRPAANNDQRIKKTSAIQNATQWVLSNIWFFIVLSWLIGAIVAILYGNLIPNILRNFFGLLLYLFFPLLKAVNPSLRSIYLTLLAAAIVQICYALANTTINDFNSYDFAAAGSISDFRSAYSTGFLSIYPLYMLSLSYSFSPRLFKGSTLPLKRLVASKLFLIVTSFCLIVTPLSKGFIAAYAILAAFSAIVAIVHGKRSGYSRTFYLILCALAALPVYYYLPADVIELLTLSYTGQEMGNSIRLIQYDYLVAELAWLGKGLGATLASGYSRDATGYGFELTYVNLVHKLGIFAIPLFISYFVTVYQSMKNLLLKSFDEHNVLALGLMGYLVIGIGNPLLISSTSVLLHCIAMYLLLPNPAEVRLRAVQTRRR